MRSHPDRMLFSHLRLRRKNTMALVLRLVALPRFRQLAGLRLGWPDLDPCIPAAQHSVSVPPRSAVLPPPVFIQLWEGAVVSDLAVLWVVGSVQLQVGIRTMKLANGLL